MSLDQSAEYAELRTQLRRAEMELVESRERVAELRRKLPQDTPVPDYVLREGPADPDRDGPVREVRLSELFRDPNKPLVLVHFMYGKAQAEPCPMCSMWADGYAGVEPHIRQRANLAVVVAGDIAAFRRYARERGWRGLRLVSAGDSTLKRDLEMESPDGAQRPGVSVFTRGPDGTPRHFYTGGAIFGDGVFRGMDLLSPVWNFFDLLPEGRGDWLPSASYPDA